VQKEFAHDDTVACQIAFEVADVLEALVPNLVGDKFRRQLLRAQKFRMHAYRGRLFVIAAIEDADAAALRQTPHAAPKIIMIEFFGRRSFE